MARYGKTHGLSKTPITRLRERIIQRCYDPKHESYNNYGERGIKVYEPWIDDTCKFIADVGPLYNEAIKKYGEGKGKFDLDRINNDGNYEPGNIRFVTKKENANNRRTCVFLEWEGIKKTITQWSEYLGINRSILYGRHRRGWSIDKILTT